MRAVAWALLLLAPLLLTPSAEAQAAPGCVGGFAARSLGDGGVLLTWSASETGIVRILRASAGGSWAEVARVDASAGAHTDATARPGVAYRYAALAQGGDVSACDAVEVSVMPYGEGVRTAMGIAFAAFVGYALVRAGAWGTRSGPGGGGHGPRGARARKSE